ncbi:hypothetical protein MJH12_16890, partial [bacterium]|nr:hypothetical protein [bacterium]
FAGKQIEDGFRKLKNSKEIKQKISDVKENFLDSLKSGKGMDLLKGLFGSKKKKSSNKDEQEKVKERLKDKKKELKDLLRGLF